MSEEEFNGFKASQYCDNEQCPKYGKVGDGIICIRTYKNKQLYCNCCKSKPFSLFKGTMFFGLRTPIDKIVSVLLLLSNGMGMNAVCKHESVTGDSVRNWIVLASNHMEELSNYFQKTCI